MEIKAFFNTINQRNSDFDLIRIGESGDGSYMIPDDLIGVKRCVSLGYGGIMTFEAHFARLGIRSLIVDKVVPDQNTSFFEFVDKFIGVNSDSDLRTISLSDLLKDYIDKVSEADNDLILQMDIELDEWLVINSLSTETLQRFRILVIEFHSLHLLRNRWVYKNIMIPVIKKILKNHVVVNIEVNSTTGKWSLDQRDWFPDTIEATFLRKDRTSKAEV
jgi:hypothetical protein